VQALAELLDSWSPCSIVFGDIDEATAHRLFNGGQHFLRPVDSQGIG
jgi:hypothetical protein